MIIKDKTEISGRFPKLLSFKFSTSRQVLLLAGSINSLLSKYLMLKTKIKIIKFFLLSPYFGLLYLYILVGAGT